MKDVELFLQQDCMQPCIALTQVAHTAFDHELIVFAGHAAQGSSCRALTQEG